MKLPGKFKIGVGILLLTGIWFAAQDVWTEYKRHFGLLTVEQNKIASRLKHHGAELRFTSTGHAFSVYCAESSVSDEDFIDIQILTDVRGVDLQRCKGVTDRLYYRLSRCHH